MKKAGLVLVFLSNQFILFAQATEQYCAKLKDGIIVMYSEQVEIDHEIKLPGGTIIKPDGNILKKDGSQLVLEDEECVDGDGNKIKSIRKNKYKKEEESRAPLIK